MVPPKIYGFLYGSSGLGCATGSMKTALPQEKAGLPADHPLKTEEVDETKEDFEKTRCQLAEIMLHRKGKRPASNCLLTWGQTEALTARREMALHTTWSPCILEKLFLVMIAVLTCVSAVGCSHVYWAYIPHPPLLQVVEWADKGPMVWVNDSMHFPAPWRSEGPAFPEEEGKHLNISLGFHILPLCLGVHPPCLPLAKQTWLSILAPLKDTRTAFALTQVLSFNVSDRNYTNTGKPNIPLCTTISYKHWEYQPVHWSDCRALEGKLTVLFHNYSYIDWGPHGKFSHNCSEDYNHTMCNHLVSPSWNKSYHHWHHEMHGLMAWHDGGLSPPRPRLFHDNILYPEQTQLWKLAAASQAGLYWEGNFSGNIRSDSSYDIYYNSTFYVQACVEPPFVLAIGTLSFNFSINSIDCYDCRLYTCINNSLDFSQQNYSLLVLRARPHIWLPVNLTREWQHSPTEGLLLNVVFKLLHRAKRFIGLLILTIMGLIGITTTAAVAGVALQTSIQTHDFVQRWQNNSHHLWTSQAKVNDDLEKRVNSIEQAVTWLGEQVISIQQQQTLACDWNVSHFCITPAKYNSSLYTWDTIKYHLQDLRGNLTLDTEQLKSEILDTFSSQLPGVPYEGLAQGIADALQGMDPQTWMQSIIHSLSAGGAVLFICFLLFFIGFCIIHRRVNEHHKLNNQIALHMLHLKHNKKEGSIGSQEFVGGWETSLV